MKIIRPLSKFSSFLATMLVWPIVSLAQVSPLNNFHVGVADGPEGRTNVQTLGNFENGVLHKYDKDVTPIINRRTPEGFFFRDAGNFNLSLANCGPGISTTCLKIDQLTGAYLNYGGYKYIQMWWEGPRRGEIGYMKEGRRANSHSVWVKGFDELYGDRRQNFTLGGYAKRRTPGVLSKNKFESDNMHDYWQTQIDWGGSPGVWREVVWRNNPTLQRSEDFGGAYEQFLANATVWRDATRLYYQFYCGHPDCKPNSVFMDNFIFFYENPFMGIWPNTISIRAQAGSRVTREVMIWNTHPTETRSYNVELSGWRRTGGRWRGTGTSLSQESLGPLRPGEGAPFTVSFDVPSGATNGQIGELVLSVYRDSAEVPDLYPYQRANPTTSRYAGRFDLLGVGLTIVARVDSNVTQPGTPLPASNLKVTSKGGSWADISWTSPATSQLNEKSTDPRAASYAIRYSQYPIDSENAWATAIPVEAIPPVFGGGLEQQYSLRGLKTNTPYYIAVRTYNESNQASSISSTNITTAAKDVDRGSGSSTGEPDDTVVAPQPQEAIPPGLPQNLMVF